MHYTTDEERYKLVEVFTTHVNLEALSPRIMRLVVHWRYPEWNNEAAIWLREAAPTQRWPDEEAAAFNELYGKLSPLELMQAFPNRTWRAMNRFAWRNHMPRVHPQKCPIEGIGERLCWNDYQLMKEYELFPDSIKVLDANSGA